MRELLLPMAYLFRLLSTLRDRGLEVDEVFADAGIPIELTRDPNAWVGVDAFAAVLARCAEIANDPGLGLELGLTTKPTSHSWYGYALMTARTVREAIELGIRFLDVRLAPWRTKLFVEGDTAVLQIDEKLDVGSTRVLLLEYFLGGMVRVGEFLHGHSFAGSGVEFRASYARPAHHARFADQLPTVTYDHEHLQARHPAAWLDRPLALADPSTNHEAIEMLETALRTIEPDDWVGRTRAILVDPRNQYPDLDTGATLLGTSSRSLRRHLQQQGVAYRDLRDTARREAAREMVGNARSSLDAIARTLGFANNAAFSRAFQRWMGVAPSEYRRSRGRG